jgi:beta-glucanase (GH16 family)
VAKKHSLLIVVFALILGGMLALSFPLEMGLAQTRDTSLLVFRDEFDSFNTTLWHAANNWTNYNPDDPYNPFDCWWLNDNVNFSSGVLSLTLNDSACPGGCGGMNYASAEYRSNNHYHYGTYTVRMKAVANVGVVSSFFLYTGPSEDNPWDEIDIEITGNNPSYLHTNYFTNGVGGNGEHEDNIPLGFDASADFHTYSIEWLPDSITWYVDGLLVHTEDGSNGALPTTPGRIMMNFWPGTDSVNDWLGDFVYSSPLQAQYDWVSYEAVDWPIKSYLPAIFK